MYESPFTVPPDARLRELARKPDLPAGFNGRVGLLLCRSAVNGEEKTLTALEPVTRGMGVSWSELRREDLWPELDEPECPEPPLTNGLGEEIPIDEVLRTIFSQYPTLPPEQGGLLWEKRKRGWRFAVKEGLRSPTVRLLNAFNRLRRDEAARGWELVGTAEWWAGSSTAHEMKHHGTFIAPKSSVKYLIDALLVGIAHRDQRPIVTVPPPIPVLYEDEAILVIDKPARLASVPGVRETFSAKSLLEATHGELKVVHRLDTDTSGLLVFAKTPSAEKALHETFRTGLALKRYVARLEGVPAGQSGSIRLPIALNALDRPRQCVLSESAGGKPSLTDWELLCVDTMPDGRRKACVALWPDTGRTHQLRVHCAHAAGLNCPIDGDSFYGSLGLCAEDGRTRLCLHAASLTFPHPISGEVMSFESAPDFPLF